MANRRMLARNISLSKKLAKLKSDFARLLWTWCIPFTDDFGRFEADPEILKAKVFPLIKSATEKKICDALNELVSVELITLYVSGDSLYGEITNFDEFQTFKSDRGRKPECPEPGEYISEIELESAGFQWIPAGSKVLPNITKDNLTKENITKRAEPSGIPVEEAIFSAWKTIRSHPNAALSEDRRKKIRERLREKRKLCNFLNAFYGVGLSRYHMGENEKRKVYDDIKTICRDATCFEEHESKWLKHREAQLSSKVHQSLNDAQGRGVVNAEAAANIRSLLGMPPKQGRRGETDG